MYTAFRSMIIVPLWRPLRCAKHGSRLCGGGAFVDRGQCLLFLKRNKKLPLRLMQSSHQPPTVWPTRRERDEARLDDRRRPLGSSL